MKPIAAGVSLDLDRVISVSRKSTLNSADYYSESFDYEQGPNSAIDPAGYACTTAPLPAGSVVCRAIRSGYVTLASGTKVRQRYATFYSYDARGRLVRSQGPVNLDGASPDDVVPVEERTYWPDTESLDRRGRLREVRAFPSPAAAPLVTSYDHDAFGPQVVTAPDGGTAVVARDGRGRPTIVAGPGTSRMEIRYYDGATPRLTVSATGAARRFTYDTKGRLASVEYLSGDPDAPGANPTLGWTEVFFHDAAGNVVRTERRDASGAVTWKQERRFDVQHRVVEEAHPEVAGAKRTWTYDASGFLTSTTDEEGRATAFTPTIVNRVATVRRSGFDAQGLPVGLDVATYSYQSYVDDLSQLKDAKGAYTKYRHDDFGRLENVSQPTFMGAFSYFYDPRGNLVKRTGGGVTVDYTYDGLDRMISKRAASTVDGSSVAYTFRYDEGGFIGRLTSVVEPDRIVRFGYDASGRLASERLEETGVSTALVTGYRYDADGDLTMVTYPSGLRVSYTLDPATKRVVAVSNADTGTAFASGALHLPMGPVRSFAFGNGLALEQTFDLRYQPMSVASGPVQLGYGMSPAGDVAAISGEGAARTFRYDFLDRLTASPGWLEYGYDGNGNRISETVEGAVASYTYPTNPASDRQVNKLVPGASGNVKTLGFGYDHQTNVSAIGLYNAAGTGIAKGICLRHDPLGRIVMVGEKKTGFTPNSLACLQDSDVGTVLARFRYDSQSRRVARWLPTTGWTYFTHGPDGSVLGETTLTLDPAQPWSRQRDYVWLEGSPLAQVEYPGPAGGVEGYAYYFHVDHIGLPRALTSAAGQVVWSATPARPYGDIAETATVDPVSGRTVVTNLRLPGQYDERLLGGIGLQGPYYNWNRWYVPGVGRYLELDPIALTGTFNALFRPDWYDYANGNPIRFVDSTGLLVELYCESLSTAQYGLGGLGAHCFLRVACEGCNQSYDLTLELFGPNQCPQYGRPMNQPFDPSFNGRGTTRRRGLSGPGMPGTCGTERCLLNSFASQPIPPYNGLGPNSNTFAAAMLGECGLVGDFPWNAVGSGQ